MTKHYALGRLPAGAMNKTEAEWFGELRLDMPAELARKLGEALIAAAGEARV